MEKAVNIWIRQAEQTWLERLYGHVEDMFDTTFLPSHDQDHHLRVWHICRKLLREIASHDCPLDPSLVEGVLIAAFFHDLGMVKTRSSEHGSLGSEMCRAYFTDSGLTLPPLFGAIREAVTLHDEKKEILYRGIFQGEPPDILTILSIADDLEALGAIGVYRYTEIYLHRGIQPQDLGRLVLENVKARFDRILDLCAACPELLTAYSSQYEYLVGFFRDYDNRINGSFPQEEIWSGSVGVVHHIRDLCVQGNIRPEEFPAHLSVREHDRFAVDFFTLLNDELKQARK